jgi:hypothetical protein
MTKFALTLVVAASALTFAPGPAAAADCTKQYVKCLNDTWYYTGMLKEMADLECSAEYAGCVAKKWLML